MRRKRHGSRTCIFIGLHIDQRHHAFIDFLLRAHQRGADVLRLLDVFAIAAQALRHFVVARVAEVASGFFFLRISGPAAVQADHHQYRQLVTHSGVEFHGVQPERAVAVHHDHLLVGTRGLGAHAEGHAHTHHAEGA